MSKKYFLLLLIFLISLSSYAFATSKEDIIKLTKAGTREEVIITHLKAQAELILSPQDIQDLKDAGVGEKVISFIEQYGGDMTKLYTPPRVYYVYDWWTYGQENSIFFYPWHHCHGPCGPPPGPPPGPSGPQIGPR